MSSLSRGMLAFIKDQPQHEASFDQLHEHFNTGLSSEFFLAITELVEGDFVTRKAILMDRPRPGFPGREILIEGDSILDIPIDTIGYHGKFRVLPSDLTILYRST